MQVVINVQGVVGQRVGALVLRAQHVRYREAVEHQGQLRGKSGAKDSFTIVLAFVASVPRMHHLRTQWFKAHGINRWLDGYHTHQRAACSDNSTPPASLLCLGRQRIDLFAHSTALKPQPSLKHFSARLITGSRHAASAHGCLHHTPRHAPPRLRDLRVQLVGDPRHLDMDMLLLNTNTVFK